jgi:hypothetical protein
MVYKTCGYAFVGFVEPRGIGFCRAFEESPTSATFMCRIYLVAYKFRFDFILWREPCASCDFLVAVSLDLH